MVKRAGTHRLAYLDSMRGIAALMVLIGHFILWRYLDHPVAKSLYFIFNAHDAVSFFFVLSGFVLSLVYLQQPKKDLFLNHFYVNRLFRLMPAFWVTLLIGVLYNGRGNLGLDLIVDTFIHNKGKFWEEFFLFKGHNYIFLPGWTLTIELVMSFLMPFLIIVARHNRQILLPFIWIVLLSAFILGFFVFHFIIGIAIAAYFDELKSTSSVQHTFKKHAKYWWVVAIVLFSLRPLIHWSPLGPSLEYVLKYLHLDIFVFTAIASGLFIILVIGNDKVQRILEWPILKFYGKISYGIYLMHWVWVTAFFQYWETFHDWIGGHTILLLIVGLSVVLLISTALATLMYHFVELPSIKFGKRMIARMKGRWNILPSSK